MPDMAGAGRLGEGRGGTRQGSGSPMVGGEGEGEGWSPVEENGSAGETLADRAVARENSIILRLLVLCGG